MDTICATSVLDHGTPLEDPRGFRRCLGQFATGVNIMTTVHGGIPAGVTANSFSSLSMDPPLVLWSIGRSSRSVQAFSESTHFCVNVLSTDQIALAQLFSSKSADKFAETDWYATAHGASPSFDGLVASFDCETYAVHDGGDHLIIVGRVLEYTHLAGAPLLYSQGRYAVAEDHPELDRDAPGQESPAGSDGRSEGRRTSLDGMRLTTLLGAVGSALSSEADKVRYVNGVDFAQGRTIFTLRYGGRLTVDEIVAVSYLTRQATEDALSVLMERQLVSASEGVYVLSEKGADLLRTLMAAFEHLDRLQLGALPKDDQICLRRVLTDLHLRLYE
jgi:flavin reductase (DIM6/NTAB) family NADH-FMN oxidoreductase RutF